MFIIFDDVVRALLNGIVLRVAVVTGSQSKIVSIKPDTVALQYRKERVSSDVVVL